MSSFGFVSIVILIFESMKNGLAIKIKTARGEMKIASQFPPIALIWIKPFF